MIQRNFWVNKINKSWQRRSIVWLAGVRRVGKTTLAKMFSNTVYLNCDLPSVARRLEDPESFFASIDKKNIVVFDEVHRLEDPSRVLKIAADEYSQIKILVTGSSTLTATKKFRDSLTGRKVSLYLPPVLWTECEGSFNILDIDKRFINGGLPELLLASQKDDSFYSEWIDSFYARDIQELFSIRNRTGFIKLLQLLLRQSGGMLDYTNLSKLCGLSRPTVNAHIEAMSVANAIFLLPPFSGGAKHEIVKRPKCYCFDTGFVTYMKGWTNIRDEDRGLLWEHLVLDMLRACYGNNLLYYWQNKSGYEVDFIIKENGNKISAIECKTNPDQFDIKNIAILREQYPNGDNYVVSPYTKDSYKKRYGKLFVKFCSLQEFEKR